MLEVLDSFLEGLFTVGPYIVIIVLGLLSCLLGLFSLLGLLIEKGSTFQKLEGLGLAVMTVCCCYWFFVWAGDMGPSQEGFSHVGPCLSFGIAAIVWFIPFILRGCCIPLFVSGFIYVGIAVYGL